MSLSKLKEEEVDDHQLTAKRNMQVEEQYHQQVSPMLEVISGSRGAQNVYSTLAAYFLMILLMKLVLIIICPYERMSCLQFFGGQFGSFHYFFQLFVVHHLILYSLVYPAGKYLGGNGLLLKLAALIAIAALKWANYSVVHVKDDASKSVRVACALENVRLMMKTISFLAEIHPPCNKVTNNVSIGQFTYFLFAPTLIYKSSYRKTNKPINWKAFTRFASEFTVMVLVDAFFVKDFVVPGLERHQAILAEKPEEYISSYIRLFLLYVAQGALSLLFVAFAFVHCYSNAMAELLCFADRSFYKNWWATESPGEMWRKWNRIVGGWLSQYVYKPCIRAGFGRFWSLTATFAVSGFYHDHILTLTSGFWRPWLTIMMSTTALQILCPFPCDKMDPSLVDILSCASHLLNLGVVGMVYF